VIVGRYSNGRLTNIRYGRAQYPDDVPLAAMPDFLGPYGYDANQQVAVAASLTADEQTDRLAIPRLLAALCVVNGKNTPKAVSDWAQAIIDQATQAIITARSS